MMSTNDERDDKQNDKITHGGYSSAQHGTTNLLALVLEFSTGAKGSGILPDLLWLAYAAH
jgi:hypothetical protein